MRFALLQWRNETAAEDAVQETMVAAIRGADSFAGGSSVRTWLVGILKHKIIDSIRKSSREQSLDQFESYVARGERFIAAVNAHLARVTTHA